MYKKFIKNRKNSVTLKHWKTDEDITCCGSFEYFIVKKLNDLKINYEFQIKFNLPNFENVYYCDFYFPDDDMYVEVKGYFYNKNKKKQWELFHKLYPNSEIWYYKKVEEFTGMKKYKMTNEFREIKKLHNRT